MSLKCYGSITVSKTAGRGSTPWRDVKSDSPERIWQCHLNSKLPRYIYIHLENCMIPTMIAQVRELLERHLDAIEIANRLHVDIAVVEQVIILLAN